MGKSWAPVHRKVDYGAGILRKRGGSFFLGEMDQMHINGRLLRTVVMAAGLMAAAGFATGAMADTKTEKVGRPGGTSFEAHCPAGQAVVGWAYNFGDVLMALGPMCQAFSDGAPSGTPTAAPENIFGAEGGTGSGSAVCQARYAPVAGLTVYTAPDLRVLSMRTTCRPMPGAVKGGSELVAYTKVTGLDALRAAGSKAPHVATACPTGSYTTGIYGSFADGGAWPGIQSIGLICHDDTATDDTGNDDSSDMADTGDQGNGDDGNGITINGFPFQLEINIGPGQNGLNFGPKGKVRTVREATTVYADKGKTELGSLDAGAKVLAFGCEKNGKGWCQIGKPMRGLVWGGDLK